MLSIVFIYLYNKHENYIQLLLFSDSKQFFFYIKYMQTTFIQAFVCHHNGQPNNIISFTINAFFFSKRHIGGELFVSSDNYFEFLLFENLKKNVVYF